MIAYVDAEERFLFVNDAYAALHNRSVEQIVGQKVVVTKARKSIAGFKVREDWPIGCKVTLRPSKY